MDWIINDELGLTVGHLLGWAAASAMVVGGVIPYLPQYKEIKQTQDADGFSLHVCLALLVANSLRILFWFSKRFELPLLVQSVVMNITMFLMIDLCVRVKRNNTVIPTNRDREFSGDDISEVRLQRGFADGELSPVDIPSPGTLKRARSRHYLRDFDMKYFWAWTDFQSYLDFMLVFWAVGAAITYIMLDISWFMETMGFFAVFVEAMLGAPQFLRNFRNKSTYGMSIHMVLMWTVGDIFKTGYFIFRNAPSQFWICGSLQVSLDLLILGQVWIYRKNSEPRNQHRGD
ncbi:PQLC1 family protein [Megaselia abdita]